MGFLHAFATATEGRALSDFGVEAVASSFPQDTKPIPIPAIKHARTLFEKSLG